MNRRKAVTTAIPLLVGVGLLVSACAASPGYAYAPYDPGYSSLDYDYGGWGGWYHARDRAGFGDRGGGGGDRGAGGHGGGGHGGGGGGHGR